MSQAMTMPMRETHAGVTVFASLNDGQQVTRVARHVTDVTAAVLNRPRCRGRLCNGAELCLAPPAQDMVGTLFGEAQPGHGLQRAARRPRLPRNPGQFAGPIP